MSEYWAAVLVISCGRATPPPNLLLHRTTVTGTHSKTVRGSGNVQFNCQKFAIGELLSRQAKQCFGLIRFLDAQLHGCSAGCLSFCLSVCDYLFGCPCGPEYVGGALLDGWWVIQFIPIIRIQLSRFNDAQISTWLLMELAELRSNYIQFGANDRHLHNHRHFYNFHELISFALPRTSFIPEDGMATLGIIHQIDTVFCCSLDSNATDWIDCFIQRLLRGTTRTTLTEDSTSSCQQPAAEAAVGKIALPFSSGALSRK